MPPSCRLICSGVAGWGDSLSRETGAVRDSLPCGDDGGKHVRCDDALLRGGWARDVGEAAFFPYEVFCDGQSEYSQVMEISSDFLMEAVRKSRGQ